MAEEAAREELRRAKTKQDRLRAKRQLYGVDLQDPDSVSACGVCASNFSLTRPKKLCKVCGCVVCTSCSKTRAPVSGSDGKPKRICDFCAALHHEAASASSEGERVVLDWVAAVLRGEEGATAGVLATAASDDDRDPMLLLMTRLLLRELVRLVPTGRLGQTLVRASGALAAFTAAECAHLAARGTAMHLQLACSLANQNRELARLFKSKQEQILAEVVASGEHGLSDALALTAHADSYWAVWQAALTNAAAVIMLDIEAICDSQLFQSGWQDDDGNELAWLDSDYTLACTEATFQDFFADMRAWLSGDDAFCRVALGCLRLVAAMYVQRLLASEVVFDAEGAAAARVREDVSILTRTFRAYETLPPRDLAPLLRPLHKLCELVDAPRDQLPALARSLATTFGPHTADVVTAVVYMRADIPRAEEGALLKDAHRAPPSGTPDSCALPLQLEAPHRAAKARSSGPAADADAAAAASASEEPGLEPEQAREREQEKAPAALDSEAARRRAEARAAAEQLELDRVAETEKLQQRLDNAQRLIAETEERLGDAALDAEARRDVENQVQQLRFQLVAAKQAASLAQARHAEARARAAAEEEQRVREEQREAAAQRARGASRQAQADLEREERLRANPPMCARFAAIFGFAPCEEIYWPWEDRPPC